MRANDSRGGVFVDCTQSWGQESGRFGEQIADAGAVAAAAATAAEAAET